MPDRDPKWRDAVLEADGYTSQLGGFDGREEEARANLTAHHIERRGMGGIPSRDELANGITLTNEEHAWEHAGAIAIREWDREGGRLIVEDVKGVMGPPGFVPPERLWFYRGRLKRELEGEERLICDLNGSDREIARLYWRRWAHDNFRLVDADAPSFRAYTEARDWPTDRAEKLAQLFDLSRTSGIEWLPGETARAYRKRLKAAGILAATVDRYFYLVVPGGEDDLRKLIEERRVFLMRCTDEVAAQGAGVRSKVGKLMGARASGGGIYGLSGEPIPFEEVTAA